MARKRKRMITQEEEIPKESEVRFSFAERELLCELARNVSPQHVVVEIADKVNESTEALAKGAQQVGARVFNLALYGKNDPIKKPDDARLRVGIREIENVNGVNILSGSAYDLTRRWQETIALLVVTSYMQYEEVREAVVFWQGYLSPEAIIVVQNRFEPGPAKAINELAADGGNLLVWRSVDNLTAMLVDKCQHYWAINSKDIGICRSCGRIRNFKRLQKEATETKNIKRTINYMKKQIQKIGR